MINRFKSEILTLLQVDKLQVLLGVALIYLCSQASIPLEPVPITLQTFGILIIGLTYTPKNAIATLVSYLALGALGAPIFANGAGGFMVFFGPTGGYLFGFLIAVAVMSLLQERFRQGSWTILAFIGVIGQGIIYAMGVSWLATFTGLGWEKAFQLGVRPFIIPGCVKVALLSGALHILQKVRS